MKRLACLLLCLTLVCLTFGLGACSKSDSGTDTSVESESKAQGDSSDNVETETEKESEEKDDKTYTLKIGMVVTENDPMYLGAEALKKAVEERTDGKLEIQIFPSSQLGDTKDLQEQAQTGSNVAVITDAARLAEMVPEIGILGAPYVLDSFEEGRKLVTSDLWNSWVEQLEPYGLKVLSFNWYQGDRHLLTNVPVEKPEDLKGIRMRTPGDPIWQNTISAMGAIPTALAWAEVYPGLQQGVIDAVEAQHPATHGANLHEVIKHITKTGHFQLITGLVCGSGWFDTLPQEYQDIVMEEALKAGDVASQATIDGLEQYEQDMKDKGVIVTEIDKTPFIEATKSVYDSVGLNETYEEVKKVLGK